MHELRRSTTMPHPDAAALEDFFRMEDRLRDEKAIELTARDQELLRELMSAPNNRDLILPYLGEKTADPFEKKLKAMLQAGVGALASEAASDVETAVAELNERYSVVNEGGKAWVFRRVYDDMFKRFYFERIRHDHFKVLYSNVWVNTVNKEGEDVPKQLGALWLVHPDRKSYRGGVIFDPTGRQYEGVLNLFEGFGVEPAKGKWNLMRDHVRDVICSGNEVHFKYLMGWMARMIQQPEKQAEVAVVLQGGKGVGKGMLANALLHLTGQHGFRISSSKHLTGNFNTHLRDTIFLFSDEAFYAGDKQHEGALKSLITEPVITIEGKYQAVVNTRNYLHIFIASNEDWAVPVTEGERRYFVLEVPDSKKGDADYFSAIMKQMESGGYAAMLHDLNEHDISAFNHRAVPETEGLQNQLIQGFETHKAFYRDALMRGSFREDYINWEETIETQETYKLYCDYAKRANERYPKSQEAFGKFLADVSGGESQQKQVHGRRFNGYSIGTLEHARDAFDVWAGIKLEWPPAPASRATVTEAMTARRKRVELASGTMTEVVVPIEEGRAARRR